MIKPKGLEELSKYLCEYYSNPPNWREFIITFVDHEDFSMDNGFRLERWEQHFRHISLDLALMDICEKHPEFGISFKTYPKTGDESNSYSFAVDKVGRLFVYSRSGWLENPVIHKPYPCARFEKFIMINNQPVVIDIKLTSWHKAGVHRKERIRSCRTYDIKHLLKQENYDKKLKPLREFWGGGSVGYIVVIPRDIYQEKKDSPIFREFISKGGVIIPFYANRLQFSQEVRDNVMKYGLRVKTGKGTQL